MIGFFNMSPNFYLSKRFWDAFQNRINLNHRVCTGSGRRVDFLCLKGTAGWRHETILVSSKNSQNQLQNMVIQILTQSHIHWDFAHLSEECFFSNTSIHSTEKTVFILRQISLLGLCHVLFRVCSIMLISLWKLSKLGLAVNYQMAGWAAIWWTVQHKK